MADKIFAEGFHFDLPRENAPSFVKGRISVHVGDAIEFLTKHRNERGFVNIDVKESKGGSIYCELNDWKPGHKDAASKEITPSNDDDVAAAIPF
jgi:hypothetical protein